MAGAEHVGGRCLFVWGGKLSNKKVKKIWRGLRQLWIDILEATINQKHTATVLSWKRARIT
jgi:hypothetical protein